MALYHHSNEKYEVAASNAAKSAREKLQKLIDDGRANAMGVIDKIQNEVPQDKIVKAPVMHFDANEGGLVIEVGDEQNTVHKHAMGQLAERGGMPIAYVNDLDTRGMWGKQLLAHNLNEIYKHQDKERYLLRSYNRQLRACLSNRFRRLDSRPILDAYAKRCQEVGAIPIQGYGTDTRVAIKAVLPMVFEPVANEVLAYGVVWGNSDYGAGALSVREFILRLWCTNYAITEETLREVHLGGRLTEDDIWSARTYELDTKRSASMVSDALGKALTPGRVNEIMAGIKAADEEKVDPKQVATYLKKHLGVGDAKTVIEAFASADIENLPAGQSKWRLSNAISWIAGKQTDADKKMDMMKLAGSALKMAA